MALKGYIFKALAPAISEQKKPFGDGGETSSRTLISPVAHRAQTLDNHV